MASALETINQIGTSVTKAIWGDTNAETHKEPVSGATGDVSKGEPYDAGNLGAKDQSKVESSLNDQADNPTPDSPSDLAEDEYYALSSSAKDKQLPQTPDTHEAKEKPKDMPKDMPKGMPTVTDVNPEEGKPLDELTGAGPRPVEQVAREHGGNAAAAASDDAAAASSPEETKKPDAEQENQQREATEAEYVKATGLAADGGDFDAAKPGAGLDADRLMEQKGLKTEDDTKGSSNGRKSSDSGRHKDKPSLGERIKNKLHHRHKDA